MPCYKNVHAYNYDFIIVIIDEQKAWGHTRQGFYGGNVDEMKQISE